MWSAACYTPVLLVEVDVVLLFAWYLCLCTVVNVHVLRFVKLKCTGIKLCVCVCVCVCVGVCVVF